MSKYQKMKPKRRTPEEREEILKLVESIVARTSKLEVTAYELSKEIDMSIPGISNILSRKTKFPDLDMLKQIDSYLVKEYENNEDSVVSEDPSVYNKMEDADFTVLMNQLKKIEDKMDKCALKQDIMFEIIKNAKEAELAYIKKAVEEKINLMQENS